jgi:hypothetical protein
VGVRVAVGQLPDGVRTIPTKRRCTALRLQWSYRPRVLADRDHARQIDLSRFGRVALVHARVYADRGAQIIAQRRLEQRADSHAAGRGECDDGGPFAARQAA